jgi:hypothetical protein
MKIVRIFLLWDDFQPEPDSVSKEALENLATVADIAGDNDLGLDVTFFTGHMSCWVVSCPSKVGMNSSGTL